ncbi:MAG TPA: SRPBCC family protein, partial [Caldilineaceae bacterium]|nr:SRPBCC family protein [Caldilineaceae bacterium]
MSTPRAEVTQTIDAPPAVVYNIIADYRTEHPAILPKPYFESLEVEQGGKGAGSVLRVTMNVWGSKQVMRLHVTEPEPGRVIKEEDPANGVSTTFTVTPVDGGARSAVTIATDWKPKPGLRGRIEGWIT